MGMGPRVKNLDGPMRKLRSESLLLMLHHLQTPFIMLVPKLILFINIEVNFHHGLAIHLLFYTLHIVCVEITKLKPIPIICRSLNCYSSILNSRIK